MQVDPNPHPPELDACGTEPPPPEILRALRISANAGQLVHAVMMGPMFKAMRSSTDGEGWKEDKADPFPPLMCEQIIAGAFRLAESFERHRQDCMDSHVGEFKSRGGEWPKPACKPEPAFGVVHSGALPVRRLSAQQVVAAMTAEEKIESLKVSAKMFGLDVTITERKPEAAKDPA